MRFLKSLIVTVSKTGRKLSVYKILKAITRCIPNLWPELLSAEKEILEKIYVRFEKNEGVIPAYACYDDQGRSKPRACALVQYFIDKGVRGVNGSFW